MASSIRTVVDAIIADLMESVPALDGSRIHRYAPWNPERMQADSGERHLWVAPVPDATDTAQPLVSDGGKLLVQLYGVVYWEDAGTESTKGVTDEDAAGDALDLFEAMRLRFFQQANVFLGGTDYLEYLGCTLPDRSGSVRWFQITVGARTSQPLV